MQKPAGYDEVKVGGDFTPVEVGGHHAIIKGVKEQQSRTGKPMIVVAFDLAKNDKQPNYFEKAFEEDIRPEKKWPYAGTKYIMAEDNEGKCSKSLKSFITAFEKSNNCETTWGDKFIEQFKGKKIGVVYGLVENEYEGKTSMRSEPRWFCEDDKADGARVPDPQYLNNNTSASGSVSADGFNKTTDTSAEEIPF